MELREAELEAAAVQEPGNEWIIMVHPDLESSYQKTTIAAYEEVWRKVGWQKADLLDENGDPKSWSEPVQEDETAPPEAATTDSEEE